MLKLADFWFSIFQAEELQPCYEENPLRNIKHPVLTSDARAWFYKQSGWAWFVAEVDGVVDWEVSIDSCGPFPEWMDWERDSSTWQDILFGNSMNMAQELMKLGIAPGQPFKIEFLYSCGVDYSQSYFGEGWSEFDWQLLEVEPLEQSEAAQRWQKWFDAYLGDW